MSLGARDGIFVFIVFLAFIIAINVYSRGGTEMSARLYPALNWITSIFSQIDGLLKQKKITWLQRNNKALQHKTEIHYHKQL